MNLTYDFVSFLKWWCLLAPKRLMVLGQHVLLLTNNAFAFTLTVRLLLTPLFGDYTIVGRMMGFVFRIGKLILGLIFISFLAILVILAVPAWYMLPFYIVYVAGGSSFVFFLMVFLLYELLKMRKPERKLTSEMEEEGAGHSVFFDKSLLLDLESDKDQFLKKFYSHPKIVKLFDFLEINKKTFLDDFRKRIFETNFSSKDLFSKTLFFAKEAKNDYIEVEILFPVILLQITGYDNFLSKFGLKLEVVKNAALWLISEREVLRRVYFWQEDYIPPPIGGVNRGMTSRVTPMLDSLSTDFTKMATFGYFDKVVGKEKAINEAIESLSRGNNNNVLIVGEPGCGKTTMVKGIAQRIIYGTDIEALKFKRLVSIELGALISGARTPGEISAKIEKIMDEVKSAGNIILFVDEIHNLVAGTGGENAELASVYNFLEPHLTSSSLQFIGATSLPNYRKYIEPNGAFARLFQVVRLEEASPKETLEILKVLTRKYEKLYKVKVSYLALEKTVELSKKLIKDRVLPDKAVDILERACVSVSKTSKTVTSETISQIISDITKVPITSVTQDESQKLLNVEGLMKKRVIGQDEAVYQIGDALRRGRLGIRDEKRPIASFLFVGSTGVGKTETAKALASCYFGSEDVMIRIDMSEFQMDSSVERLLGSSDGKTLGILTEKVRTSPYSLILLDEIEKASSKVLLIFLQVLDDGRLTDNQGRVIDFTNSIIIATSNVGTVKIQEVMKNRGTIKEMEEKSLEEVRERFAPEFLNRFSGIIMFKPLYPSEVKQITVLLLDRVVKTLDEKGVKVKFKEELIEKLAHDGFDPQWGARPLRRLVENTVESYLARKLLTNEIVQGDQLEIGTEVFK